MYGDHCARHVWTHSVPTRSSSDLVSGDGAPGRAKGASAMRSREPDLLARVRALTWIGDRRWTVRLDDMQGGGIDVQLPEAGAAAAWSQLAVMEDRKSTRLNSSH